MLVYFFSVKYAQEQKIKVSDFIMIYKDKRNDTTIKLGIYDGFFRQDPL